jgi:hypothetical protein
MVAFPFATGGRSGSNVAGSTVTALSSASSSVIEGFRGSIGPLAFASEFGEIISVEVASFGACATVKLAQSTQLKAMVAHDQTDKAEVEDTGFTRALDADLRSMVARFCSQSPYVMANKSRSSASKRRRRYNYFIREGDSFV